MSIYESLIIGAVLTFILAFVLNRYVVPLIAPAIDQALAKYESSRLCEEIEKHLSDPD
jgi:hypothetical protein